MIQLVRKSRILLKQLACSQQICGKKIISFCPRVPTTHIPIIRPISFLGKSLLSFFSYYKLWIIIYFVRTPKIRYLSSNGKKTTDSASDLKISLISNMDVTERFWSYGFVEWIAECGGFGGLFLGYSFSQIGDFIEFVSGIYKKYIIVWIRKWRGFTVLWLSTLNISGLNFFF